jgi:hypothetical protein
MDVKGYNVFHQKSPTFMSLRASFLLFLDNRRFSGSVAKNLAFLQNH